MSAVLDALAAVWTWLRSRAASKAAAQVEPGKRAVESTAVDLRTVDEELRKARLTN